MIYSFIGFLVCSILFGTYTTLRGNNTFTYIFKTSKCEKKALTEHKILFYIVSITATLVIILSGYITFIFLIQ